ncbi:MAG: AgmX/PglI C-terminal domain-containing protein, partial [Bacteriovoracia bacterium]
LVTLGDPHKSKEESTFRFHKSRIVIGSVESADLKLAGKGVAPIHAVIELGVYDKGAGHIFDLASDEGLYLNGKKVISANLKEGDRIKIGGHEVKFFIEDAAHASQTEPGAEFEGRKLFFDPKEDFSSLILEDEREVEEIFEPAPNTQRALEVIMSWRGMIMDVEHFVDEPLVTIGESAQSDFPIPGALPASPYSFVSKGPQGYALHFDGSMQGVIQSEGQLKEIAGLKEKTYLLRASEFAKVSVGEVDFYLSYTAAPPNLKRRRLLDRDAFFVKVLLTSFLMTTAAIVGMVSVPIKDHLDVEELPERIATVLYQPEKYSYFYRHQAQNPSTDQTVFQPKPTNVKPKPSPVVTLNINPSANPSKRVPDKMDASVAIHPKNEASAQNQAKNPLAQTQGREGEGARAKGAEGTRGTKTGPKHAENQTVAGRRGQMMGAGKGGGNSQVEENEGNVDLLKGASAKIQSLLGNTASQLGKSGGKLSGFGAFNTQGSGGLALSGTGSGGGGNAESLGGLSDKGRGGGRVGTGLGAAGTGENIVGGRARVVLNTGGPEETVVMGAIDADAVEAALLAHRDEFRLCYEREINAGQPNLAGRVGTTFVIGPRGRVTRAGIVSTTLKNTNTERCILKVIQRIDFPIPRGGGVVQVNYPFKFRPVGGQ